ncbi:hypothetical protein GPJ56_000075 [Histomonas meleagridis]|uniref:uncharacterized protein n=1 Tax=Histomonas meleagridis TaxID=135588 RepID=UPI003559509C|nr:hypothetical protein GPJ56_000075 [Histomonas meleagridis]KAH0805574.1 hypothetical protein GO595_001629 [Histomonas meleagridis]
MYIAKEETNNDNNDEKEEEETNNDNNNEEEETNNDNNNEEEETNNDNNNEEEMENNNDNNNEEEMENNNDKMKEESKNNDEKEDEEEESTGNIGFTVNITPKDITTGSSTAYLGFRYYWNKPKEGEDPFELGPIERDFGFIKLLAGAYSQIYTTFDIKTEDDGYHLEADIELTSIAGIGFKLPKTGENQSVDFEIPIPIYATPALKMYGIDFA